MNGALPQKTEILPVASDEKSAADCTAAQAVAVAALTERGGVFAFSEFSDGCAAPSTWPSSRSPSAILVWLEALESPVNTSIQNISGLPQGLAGPSAAG